MPWSGLWSGLWSGRVAGVVEAAAHTRAGRAGFAGARVVQGAAAGPPSEFGGQGHAVVDFLGPPPVDVQQQTVQRPADQFGVGPVWKRAGVGVVVVRAFPELRDEADNQGSVVGPFRAQSSDTSLVRAAIWFGEPKKEIGPRGRRCDADILR